MSKDPCIPPDFAQLLLEYSLLLVLATLKNEYQNTKNCQFNMKM